MVIMAKAWFLLELALDQKEALELRDNDNALFNGKSVLKAVNNITKKFHQV